MDDTSGGSGSGEPIRVLLLREPGAHADRLGDVAGEMSDEVVACSSRRVEVVCAVGNPGDALPYEVDVVAHLRPRQGEVEVEVTGLGEDVERFTMPSESQEELRAIARRIAGTLRA